MRLFDVRRKILLAGLAILLTGWCGMVSGEMDEEIALQLYEEGMSLYEQREYNQALEKFETSLRLNKKLDNKEAIFTNLNNIGKIYGVLGESDKALGYYKEALRLAKEVKNKKYIANSLNNIGRIYRAKGELDKTLEYYKQALKIDREIGEKEDVGNDLSNIGVVYQDLGDYQKALEYYGQALKLDREMQNKAGIVANLNNIGKIYGVLGESDKALGYYKEALRLDRETGDKTGITRGLNNIEETYKAKGEQKLSRETSQPAPSDLSEIIEDELEKLTPGPILFNPPQEMTVGVKERIELRIAKTITEDLTLGLKGRGVPQIEEIKVGTFMKAHLTGDNFDVKALSHEEQIVAGAGFTQWDWDVMPLKSGIQSLLLTITVRIKIPNYGEERKDYPVFEKQIKVKVNPIYSIINFIKSYWQWIVSTIIGSGIIGLFAKWRKNSKKEASMES